MIEMVVAIVVVGIVLAATIFFAYPLRQAVDATTRASLTDSADNALQRIAREVHLALPNSVRVANPVAAPASFFVEFIPLRTAGRYRSESAGACGATGTDELAFDVVDTCFRTIGPMTDVPTISAANDFLVFNNYGPGFDGQNAYCAVSSGPTCPGSGILNVRKLSTVTDEVSHQMLTFVSATALSRSLHDSTGKRFYIVPGNGTAPAPVSFECTPPNLLRWSGYTMAVAQPTSFGTAVPSLLADNVASCDFNYQASAVGAGIGLLTMRITLTKPVSGGTQESVTLYHAVHVNNVP